MNLTTLQLGPLATNCYILEGEAHRCVVVDPAGEAELLLGRLERMALTVEAILLTHCHFDHIGALRALKEKTGAPVYLHPEDLTIAETMAHHRLTETLPYPPTVEAAGLTLRVYHTPGHCPGAVCLSVGDLLFTGDTLFAGCCGRIDLPGGDYEAMCSSLGFLSSLPGNPRVLPGHGEASTLEQERQTNPYL